MGPREGLDTTFHVAYKDTNCCVCITEVKRLSTLDTRIYNIMGISTLVARSWPKEQLTWRTRINLFLLHPWTCRFNGLVYAILLLPLWVFCIVDRLIRLALARRQGRKVGVNSTHFSSFPLYLYLTSADYNNQG